MTDSASLSLMPISPIPVGALTVPIPMCGRCRGMWRFLLAQLAFTLTAPVVAVVGLVLLTRGGSGGTARSDLESTLIGILSLLFLASLLSALWLVVSWRTRAVFATEIHHDHIVLTGVSPTFNQALRDQDESREEDGRKAPPDERVRAVPDHSRRPERS